MIGYERQDSAYQFVEHSCRSGYGTVDWMVSAGAQTGAEMMQTRLHSLLESMVNIAIGYGVALASQILIFPLYGIRIPISDNIAIGGWFTVVSIVRSYAVRRWFTRKTETCRPLPPS